MNPIPLIFCSTTRAVAIPRAFSSLWRRAWWPALCGILALMLSGAWAAVHAQAAHFTQAQSVSANAANNLGGSRAGAADSPVLFVTSSNGTFGTVNVGSTSPTPISLMFTFDTTRTLGSTTVVTQGATGLDFTDAGTGTCKAGTAYGAGATCTIDVSFSPKFAGTRYGAAELLDGSGTVLATSYLQGTGAGPQLTFLPGAQSVVADASNGLAFPDGVAVDGSGNVYIANSNQVLKETPSAGGYSQSVIPTSGLSFAIAVAVDASGNVYIADYNNSQVLKETLSAGSYTQRVLADAAHNGLNRPTAVAVDGSGNLYICDTGSGRVLKETLSSGNYIAQTIVADTASNGLNNASGVAVDGTGNVYIADSFNLRVLKETLSGGSYTQSVIVDSSTDGLSGPAQVAVDGDGNVYIVYSNAAEVVKAAPSAGGYTLSVVANAANNGLYIPHAVAVDGGGNVYIAHNYSPDSQVLKEDMADPPALNFPKAGPGSTSPTTVTLSNNGNAALVFPLPGAGDNPSLSANFAWDTSSTCVQTTAGSAAAFELAGGTSCTMAIDYKPTAGGATSGTAELTDNNLNGTGAMQTMQLNVVPGSQTINFTLAASEVYYGSAPITLSATGGGSGNPVVFSLNSGPGYLSGPNNSVLTITGLGAIFLVANQAGNSDYYPAPEVSQTLITLYSQVARLTAPTPGSTLTGSSATFAWSPGTGPTQYMLYLGTNGVRSNNLYNSGPITTTSVNVTGLPVSGQTIYARLLSYIAGAWNPLDYTYTAPSLQVALVSPVPGSTLPGSNVTFAWSAVTGVTKYELYLGTNGSGSDNLYHSGIITATSVNVTGLPVSGQKINARLYWYTGGAWQYLDYTYTAQ